MYVTHFSLCPPTARHKGCSAVRFAGACSTSASQSLSSFIEPRSMYTYVNDRGINPKTWARAPASLCVGVGMSAGCLKHRPSCSQLGRQRNSATSCCVARQPQRTSARPVHDSALSTTSSARSTRGSSCANVFWAGEMCNSLMLVTRTRRSLSAK